MSVRKESALVKSYRRMNGLFVTNENLNGVDVPIGHPPRGGERVLAIPRPLFYMVRKESL